MMKVAFIYLFLSTAAAANASSLCRWATDTLFLMTRPSESSVLERQIKQKFYALHDQRVKSVEKATGVDEDDYFAGLSNLAKALDGRDVTARNPVKFDSIYITRRGGISVRMDIFGEPYVNIPHNTPKDSIHPALSNSLLEFGIERKLKKRRGILGIVGRGENLSDGEYGDALETFYKALEEGPVPEELGKLYEITITKEKGFSSSFWSSDISNEGLFRASLNVPAHVVDDLEGMAIAVLELEATNRLAKNYSWRGYRNGIDNIMVGSGVDRKVYKEVLKKLIAKLTDSSIMVPNKFRSGNTGGVDLANLGRIHIINTSGAFTARHYSARDGAPLVDLFFPANATIDPFAFPHFFSLSP